MVFDPIGVLTEVDRVMKKNSEFYATIPHDLHWKTRVKTFDWIILPGRCISQIQAI